MLLKGLQKLTLLDFPGKMACTVFTGGCNYKCPFCHNASLVIGERLSESATLPTEEFFAFLQKRRGLLVGVCVSGGEPTLQPDLIPFLAKIKEMGFLVKLDTNGYRPDILKAVIDEGLVDYVAMDIKSSREGYSRAAGVSIDISKIEESVETLLAGRVDFEFRTTVVKGIHTEAEMRKIGLWIGEVKNYFLQPYRDSGDVISAEFGTYDENELNSLLKVLKMHIPNAQIRG